MLVQPVVVPGLGTRSWTVLGDDDVPVVPVDRFLAYLTDIGRSPNTVKAYAHDLKDLLGLPRLAGAWTGGRPGWRTSGSSSRGCSSRRRAGRGGRGAAVGGGAGDGGDGQPQARRGERVLRAPGPQRRRGGRPAGRLENGRAGRLEAVPAPRQQGEAVSRPGDHAEGRRRSCRGSSRSPRRRRSWTPAPGCGTGSSSPCCTRPAAGRARRWACGMRTSPPPSGRSASLPGRTPTAPGPSPAAGRSRSAPELIRLYADYLHGEYGGIDSDYVFVNSGREPRGRRGRIRRSMTWSRGCGRGPALDFDPHWFRHSMATRLLRDGVSVEVVSKLLGHSSVTITLGHLRAPDRGGRPGGAGEGRLVDRAGGVLVTGGWITRADRARWQRDAARELAAILGGCDGLPLIAWTVGAGRRQA